LSICPICLPLILFILEIIRARSNLFEKWKQEISYGIYRKNHIKIKLKIKFQNFGSSSPYILDTKYVGILHKENFIRSIKKKILTWLHYEQTCHTLPLIISENYYLFFFNILMDINMNRQILFIMKVYVWMCKMYNHQLLSWILLFFYRFRTRLITTFNNISVISWRPFSFVEETGEPEENHWPVAGKWQTLSHLSGVWTHISGDRHWLHKSNYHTITTTTSPYLFILLWYCCNNIYKSWLVW
jgi:hypothetical protein